MNRRGVTLIEMMVAIVIMGILLAIAIPSFGSVKMAMSFSSAEQEVHGLLSRARWSAITSGRQETRVTLDGSILRVRAGADADSPVVAAIDVSDFDATIAQTNLPVRISSRGFRLNPPAAVPTIILANPRISAARNFTIDPLGRVNTF